MAERGIKVYAHIFEGKGIEEYQERYRRGLEVNETPYAFHLAEEFDAEIEFSSDGKKGILGKIIKKMTGLDIAHAYHNVAKIKRSDAVWAMTENESLAVAMLMMLGLAPRKPIVSSSVWMVNEWAGISPLKKTLFRRLSKYVPVMTVQSEKCLPVGRAAFPGSEVELMYFGVNTEVFTWTPAELEPEPKKIVVFSAGNDRTRDWKTAIDAFGGDDRFELRIWCHWLDRALVEGKDNIVLLENLSTKEFVEEIKQATFCLISMKENIFSGLTFALNAASIGRPVICSDTGGVPTYFSYDQAFYVPVGNAAAMRDAALNATSQQRYEKAADAQKVFVERGYSAKAMAGYYARTTRRLLAAGAQGD